jgi:xanthine dehydrogenase accessory factor
MQSPETDVWPQNPNKTQHLIDPSNPPLTADDARTAFVCLFHDHDWEAALLQQALAGPAFYIGAMGSKRTHHTRCQTLAELGVSPQGIARINGPIGLIGSQRDARLLALSILAEILQYAQAETLL